VTFGSFSTIQKVTTVQKGDNVLLANVIFCDFFCCPLSFNRHTFKNIRTNLKQKNNLDFFGYFAVK